MWGAAPRLCRYLCAAAIAFLAILWHPSPAGAIARTASGTTLANAAAGDFNGDGTTDYAVFRPADGTWYVRNVATVTWGVPGDIPVPGDYNNDAKTDYAVFRPSTGTWFLRGIDTVSWGTAADVPTPGDYDGDGDTDVAYFRPTDGTWYVRGLGATTWGMPGDIPVPGDYNGDRRTDYAVYRPADGTWYVRNIATVTWGVAGDLPVAGDYNADGRTDYAVYRASNKTWYVRNIATVVWGAAGDIPAPGDFDGDRKTDYALYRPAEGTWYVQGRSPVTWGIAGDIPIGSRSVLSDDAAAPSAPSNLRVVSRSATTISVAWDAATDNVAVGGYGVYVGPSLVFTTAATSYTFSGLDCGTSYGLAIDAYDAAGNRSARAGIAASTDACPAPPSCPPLLTQPPPGYCTGRVISVTPSTLGTGIFGTGGVALAPGDVVVFEDGVYTDSGGDGTIVQINTGGTSSQYVTFVSRNRWGAKIDGVNNTARYGFNFGAATGNVRIEGFDIFGMGSSLAPALVAPSASGVFIQAGGDNSQIVGNSVHNIGNFCNTTIRGQTGVFIQRSGVLVENNAFQSIGRYDPGENGCTYGGTFNKYKNSDTAVYLQSPNHSNVTIRNNLFSKLENGYGVYVYQGGPTGLKILNNTFVGGNPYCKNAHVFTDADMNDFQLKNNVFRGPSTGYAWAWDLEPLTNVVAANNVASGGLMVSGADCSSGVSPLPSGVTASANKLSTDPQLVDPNAPLTGGFKLQSTSPAIDAGADLSALGLNRDYDAAVRPAGAAYDAGAYEYAGAAPPPPPPPPSDTQAPSTPAGLAKTGSTTTSISVSWTASTDNVGVTGYGLYRDGSSTGSTTSTSATFGGLGCGTSYTLGVDAYDAAGNRSSRTSITASTDACPPPPPPPPGGCPVLSTPTPVPGYCTGRVLSITPGTFGAGVFGSGGIAVSPGDVVVFEDGTYTDTNGDGAVLTIRGSGTSTQWITFVSRTKWGAHMWGNNNDAAEGIALAGADYVRVEGFEVSDVGNVGSPRGSSSGIDLYDGGKHSQIVGNHIHDIGRVCADPGNTNGQVGIYIQTGKSGGSIIVENNLVHDIGRFFVGENGCGNTTVSLDHGMYLNGSTGGGGGASNVTIRNNVFHDTHHGWGVQMYPGSVDNIQVLNNTFAFCNESKSYTCIVLDAVITNSSIKNNVFYNPPGGKTIEAAGFSGSITIGNNLTSGSAMHDQGSTPSGMSLVANLLSTSAQLVNAAAGDFRLQGTSPAIDRGESLSSVTIDHAGRSRPQGAGHDVGAHEYAG